MEVLFKHDLIVVENEKPRDKVSPKIVIERIVAATQGISQGKLFGRLLQWVCIAPLSYPIGSEAEPVHMMKVVKTVGLRHVAVFINQKASRVHFADIDNAVPRQRAGDLGAISGLRRGC